MAVSYKGLTIKFGGDTTALQGALRTIQSESKETQSDLRDINKALKFDPNNTMLLEQKVKALNAAYNDTAKRLDAYKQALAQLDAKKQSGAKLTAEEERQYDSLKRAIHQCESQMDGYSTAIQETTRHANGSKTALFKMGQAIEDNADKIANAGSKVESFGKGLSGGMVAAGAAITGFATSQEEAIEQNAQLETAFESAGSSADKASDIYADYYQLLGEGDTSTEAAQNLIRLTRNEKELAKWTNINAGVFAEMGDALPLENLSEAAQESAKTGTVVSGLADVINWSTATSGQWNAALSGNHKAQKAFNKALKDGATHEDAFNAALGACSTEQERATLITDVLNGLYGETGKKYRENNADMLAARDSQNELNQSMRELGEAAMPVKQAVTDVGTELLNKLSPALEKASNWYKNLTPEQQNLATNLALGTVAFGGVTTAVGKTMQAASTFGGALKTAGTGVGTLSAKAKGLTSATGLIGKGWTAFTGLIAANPIALGVAAVAAAVAGLTWFFTKTETGKELWSNFTGWIGEKWQSVCDTFSGAADFLGGCWDGVKSKASELKAGLSESWEGIKSKTSEAWGNVKNKTAEMKTSVGQHLTTMKNKASNAWNGIKSTAGNAWNGLKSVTANAFGNVKNTVSTDLNTAKRVGSLASRGMKSLMSGDFRGAQSAASDAFGAIRGNIANKMNNAKTNAVNAADRIGSKLGFPGLGSKVSQVFSGIKSKITNPISDAWNTIKGIPDKISNAFSNISISIPKPKMPHFSVSWSQHGPVKLPDVDVSWYAKGGYFDRASIIGVGEAGGEFVAPEKQLWKFIENAVNNAFSRSTAEAGKNINVSVVVNATVANSMDAYETGRQIGDGVATELKQRGVVNVV